MNTRAIRWSLAIICLAVLSIGSFLLGRLAARQSAEEPGQYVATTSANGSVIADIAAFSLINPTVTANLGKYFIIKFTPLKAQFSAIQASTKHKTYIYFLYLNNASWIGLNERDLYTAASTIKVPLAITIYKLVEDGKLNLQDTYKLDRSDLDANFGSLYKRGVGTTLSIQELLDVMLRDSDNTAAHALLHVTDLLGIKDPFADVYDAMGWQAVDFGSKPTYIDINTKTLSNMFIALYNATYLSPADSQAILRVLDESHFNQQIGAGIPSTLAFSHKIGIDEIAGTYSDCGIIYVPHRPYILCVGAQGMSQMEADNFMARVSQAAYQYVTTN
jgi:beta-lactamase class A